MKASKTFNFSDSKKEYVIELRKQRKFPWWIFLFLLLLIFLIPVDRTTQVKALDKRNNAEISEAQIKINYTFNEKTAELSGKTGQDGITEFILDRYPLYRVLFGKTEGQIKIVGEHSEYLPVSADNTIKEALSKTKLLYFEKPGKDLRIVTIDSLTGELLSDIEVTLEYSGYTDKKTTQASGIADFKEVVLKPGNELVIRARNEKYENVRKKISIKVAGEPKVDTLKMLSIDKGGMKGDRGEVNVNLKWESTDDLDIMMVTPCKDTVFFKKRELICKGFTGKLDLDANAESSTLLSSPQENIFWDTAPDGEYKILLLFYKRNKLRKVPYTITLIIDDKKQIFTGKIKTLQKPQVINEFTFGQLP